MKKFAYAVTFVVALASTSHAQRKRPTITLDSVQFALVIDRMIAAESRVWELEGTWGTGLSAEDAREDGKREVCGRLTKSYGAMESLDRTAGWIRTSIKDRATELGGTMSSWALSISDAVLDIEKACK